MSLLSALYEEIRLIASEGGWVFGALVVLAFGIAYSLLSIWNAMRLPDAPLLSSREWLELLSKAEPGKRPIRKSESVDNPDDSDSFSFGFGPLQDQLAEKLSQSGDLPRHLQEVGQRLFARSERRFPFAFIMISTAPLVGLLGTVSGMFTTFRGMASRTAASPIEVISDGISEALITTQAGLVIGVPTFIVCAWLKSRHDDLILQFRQLESRLLQNSVQPGGS